MSPSRTTAPWTEDEMRLMFVAYAAVIVLGLVFCIAMGLMLR